jgi:sugar transferase (PEP-CTERM system associated)
VTIRVIKHHLRLPILLVAASEAVVFMLAPYLAVAIYPDAWNGGQDAADPALWHRSLLFAASALLCFAATGLYDARQRSAMSGILLRVLAAVLAVYAVTAMVSYVVPALALDQRLWLGSIALAGAGTIAIRVVFSRVVDQDTFKRRVLVFGAGRQAMSITQLRRRVDRRGFLVVGYVPAASDGAVSVPAPALLPGESTLPELCERLAVDEVVVAMDDRRHGFPMLDLLQCRVDGVEVTDLVTFLEREAGKVKLDVLHPSWIIFSEGFIRGRIHASAERVLDVMASVVLLTLTLPVMLLTAVAIKAEDGLRAPVLYRQRRVGQGGRTFDLLKFRSMRVDAEADGSPRWATRGDSRVTRVGAFIRKVRIDELPQVLNVLRGDMSFVGPRPERPEFVRDFEQRIPFYRERHTIKPGITGWAQVCYPYGSSERDAIEKLQYDLYYVKNHSVLFYVVILLLTVEVIIWGKGAR